MIFNMSSVSYVCYNICMSDITVVNILGEIDDRYREQAAESYQRQPKRFWPTEASAYVRMGDTVEVVGTCVRKMFYHRKGYVETNPPSATGMRKMNIGKLVEIQEIDKSREIGYDVRHNEKFLVASDGRRLTDEQALAEQFYVSGEVDAIMEKDGNTFGVEYKSGYGWFFVKECIGDSKAGTPKIAHLMQVMLYLYAYPEIPYWLIVYIDRGDCKRKQHVVMLKDYSCKLEATGEYVDTKIPLVYSGEMNVSDLDTIKRRAKPIYLPMFEIFRRFGLVQHYLDKNETPPRDFQIAYSDDQIEEMKISGKLSRSKYEKFKNEGQRPGHFNCSYCGFKSMCYSPAELSAVSTGPNTDTETDE